MSDYSSILKKYGVTADQVRGMSDSQLAPFAKKEGFSVSQVRAALGTSAPAAGSPASPTAPVAPGDSHVQEGFGGQKQWDVLEEHALGPSDASKLPGLEMLPMDRIGETTLEAESALGGVGASINKLSEANASLLKGEIPADVAASVRRAASENSIVRGIGGQAARALSARDLGINSMDIQQRGIQNEDTILEAKNAYAAARESIRQFNTNRNTAIFKLSTDARQQNLAAVDVERQRIATNIDANVNIMNQIANMAMAQQQTAATAAAQKIDPSNIIASLDNMIAQFTGKLS